MAGRIDVEALAEASRLAHELVARLDGAIGAFEPPPNAKTAHPQAAAASVRNYLKARRAREEQFPPDLFADPAWDMLLDLFASTLEGRTVGVGGLCIAAVVPTTTALRWIGRLETERLVERLHDPSDARRAYVRLTHRGYALVENWVDKHLPAAFAE
jgi:hypothetical protein